MSDEKEQIESEQNLENVEEGTDTSHFHRHHPRIVLVNYLVLGIFILLILFFIGSKMEHLRPLVTNVITNEITQNEESLIKPLFNKTWNRWTVRHSERVDLYWTFDSEADAHRYLTLQTDPEADFGTLTHANDKYGFAIDYPGNWFFYDLAGSVDKFFGLYERPIHSTDTHGPAGVTAFNSTQTLKKYHLKEKDLTLENIAAYYDFENVESEHAKMMWGDMTVPYKSEILDQHGLRVFSATGLIDELGGSDNLAVLITVFDDGSVMRLLYYDTEENKSIVESLRKIETLKESDWKTYRNEEYGFEFEYPDYYGIYGVDRSNGSGLHSPPRNGDDAIFAMNSSSTLKSPGNSFKVYMNPVVEETNWLQVWEDNSRDVVSYRHSYSQFLGTTTFKGDTVGLVKSCDLGGCEELIEVPTEKYLFKIEISSDQDGRYGSDQEIKNIAVRERMVASFKFIDNGSEWKTYRNEEYGFEFKYPGDWYIVFEESGIVGISPTAEGSSREIALIMIGYEKHEGLTYAEYNGIDNETDFCGETQLSGMLAATCVPIATLAGHNVMFIENLNSFGSFSVVNQLLDGEIDKGIIDSIRIDESKIESEWKTYRNEGYGFEFEYPSDWTHEEYGNGVSFYTPEAWSEIENGSFNTPSSLSVLIEPKNEEVSNVSSYAQQHDDGWYIYYEDVEAKTVNGLETIYYTDRNASLEHHPIDAIFVDIDTHFLTVVGEVVISEEDIGAIRSSIRSIQ